MLNALATATFGFYKRPKHMRLRGLLGRGAVLANRLVLLLIIAGIASGFATYAALTETPPFGDDPNTVIWLLNLDLIILLALVTVIARRVVGLWSGRRRGIAGSRLHVRLVFIFSLLTAMPAIIMTVFSAFFLNFAIQSWFSDRVSTAVNNAQAVAEAYLEEHKQVIRADALAMAGDLERQAAYLIGNPDSFEKFMQTQSLLRNLSEAIVFDDAGHVLGRSGFTFTMAFETLPGYAVMQAQEGDVFVMTGGNDDRVRALVKLANYPDSYLFVGRMVDPVVLSNLNESREAVASYKKLEEQRSDLQLTFTMIFVVVALMLLLAAVWFGLIFSRQMVIPISALISAADRVRGGDMTARVPEFDRRDEFDVLARAFNRMTSQIQEQRDELVQANRQLDQRRRFTETVLAGVTSGVIGVDVAGNITLANAMASNFFKMESKELVGNKITKLIPELDDLLREAHEKPGKITQAEVPLVHADETKHTLLVRIAIELIGEEDKGAVLTFDDITELQSAQRKAAWADVARRIAHEIKNPLTPIQLSAERLRKKYLSQITDDPETFSKCTDTIIHHVGDIGRMVNEFSAFARMPEPVMKHENLTKHLKDMIVLQQQAHTDIRFNLIYDYDKPLYALADAQQIRQALTNIIQNAIDGIRGRFKAQAAAGETVNTGQIDLMLTKPENDVLAICVTDSGIGLPKDSDLSRLTEPYVTHRDKGTGLGLAIVKKIMEDHNGRIVLNTPEWVKRNKKWRDLGGATVILTLPEDRNDKPAEKNGKEAA